MKKQLYLFSFILAMALGYSLQGFSQGGLFETKEPLHIELEFSVKQLKAETDDSTFISSQMIFESSPGQKDTLEIEIRTRGNFRLDNCYYPPMRVKMKKKDVENTVFQGDRSLKLVLPCSKAKTADNFLGKEYLAYQLYEDITEYTFRTRVLRVKFINSDDKKGETVELLGFFIEDDDEVADRFDGEILDDKKIIPTLMEDTATVRHDFFQLMIGNTDWSGLFQHNEKVLKLDDKTIVPLAYDFDMTGLVNPPYAQVNNNIGIERVTDRLYRGFCRDPQLMQAIRAEILAKESRIFETVEKNKVYFSEPDEKACRNYLKDFFDILKSDGMFEQKVLNACRTNTASQTF
ncbi:hypothetical protein [Algoriphagus sp. A40]|uniref:hypothetical protein n=1 Tax=Algoriphagus sp. A40 TaxID=1945863 RepID=UPI0009848E25|nr:hypothetical protein [Algoriphagus sp. A40]OOG68603.1 hypothetical protein B0E43_22160 [Algoriphagus sp. A40]